MLVMVVTEPGWPLPSSSFQQKHGAVEAIAAGAQSSDLAGQSWETTSEFPFKMCIKMVLLIPIHSLMNQQ